MFLCAHLYGVFVCGCTCVEVFVFMCGIPVWRSVCVCVYTHLYGVICTVTCVCVHLCGGSCVCVCVHTPVWRHLCVCSCTIMEVVVLCVYPCNEMLGGVCVFLHPLVQSAALPPGGLGPRCSWAAQVLRGLGRVTSPARPHCFRGAKSPPLSLQPVFPAYCSVSVPPPSGRCPVWFASPRKQAWPPEWHLFMPWLSRSSPQSSL